MFRAAFSLFLIFTLCLLPRPAEALTKKEEAAAKAAAEAAEEEARKATLRELPNLVLIIADDLAWDDSTPYGHESIMTPNLDRLSREGMTFDNAYVTASSCSPSRASIITGRYPHQTDAEELHWPVPKEQVTFVEQLKEKGYWTGAAGKWHLGDEIKDRFHVIKEADESGFTLPSGAEGADGAFKESLEGDARSGCADWISLIRERPTDVPFFLWLAALDPHRPYHERILDDPAHPEEVRLPPYQPDTPTVRAEYALYYDEITRLDRYVGEVLDELDQQGVADQTLVLFISDNGRPFSRDKTTLYDSGIKTPWIVRWPEKVAAGTRSPRLVSTVDIARTFLKLAGIENPGLTFEGQDFSRLLGNPEAPLRDYIYAEKNWHDYEDHARAVRNERYKYIRNDYVDLPLTPPSDVVRGSAHLELLRLEERGGLTPAQRACFTVPRPSEELYDTKLDPYELTNLAADERYAPLLRAMRAALDDWTKKTKDLPQEVRSADEFDRVTGLPNEHRIRPRPGKAKMIAEGLAAP